MSLQHRLHCRVAQDSLASPVPPELADCYFLEEWQRLQLRRAELRRQRRTFDRERRSFTDAAVRLSREVRADWTGLQRVKRDLADRRCCPQRCQLEQEKASLVKQQYLSDSPQRGHSRGGHADVGECMRTALMWTPPSSL